MPRVKDIMTTEVPRVKGTASLLEAVKTMNQSNSTGVAVVDEGGQIVGIVTARRLLTDFLPLNKKPEEVKVNQVMGPFYRISPDASTREAAKKIIEHDITRLGVFEDDKFLGWVDYTDVILSAREFSKRRLIEFLKSNDKPKDTELLCPNCRGAFMQKITDSEGEVLRWTCPKCNYSL